jgi:endogenous inhibitor of DNA gyrase (YacG/DUF329 family)
MTRVVKCPTCRQETVWQGNPYRPFCSARCRTIDLGSWAAESYRIPAEQLDPENLPAQENASSSPDQSGSEPHAHSSNRLN